MALLNHLLLPQPAAPAAVATAAAAAATAAAAAAAAATAVPSSFVLCMPQRFDRLQQMVQSLPHAAA